MKKYELIDNETLVNQTCLYNTKPIILNPELALILGDSDLALIFQQIHYWININKQNAEMELANINTYHNNRFWCFQTYEQWEQQFIWLDKKTIIRKIRKLEDLGVLISDNFNKLNLDNTKWYSIDYKKLLELQNKVFHKKLDEKNHKIKIRKEQEKKAIVKFKALKKSRFSEMDKMSISRNGQNVHLQIDKMSIAIQETNYKEINSIQDRQSVCLEEEKETNNEMTDIQDNHIQDFKIEIETNNELNNTVIDIANDLLANQRTITVSNRKLNVSDIIKELKTLSTEKIHKLIEYVARKFENNNSDIIINKTKYIASIFANAIFERGYLLSDVRNNNVKNNNEYTTVNEHRRNTTYGYGKNKFMNYKQTPPDYDLLRKIEIFDLTGRIVD